MITLVGVPILADSGPAIHIAPTVVLRLGGLEITNSIVYGWVCMAVMTVVLIILVRFVTIRPKRGVIQFVEIGVEFMMRTVESGFEDKDRAKKYVPFFVTLFFFVLINNWLGLVPGVGQALTVHGEPLLRPYTGDLNGTLAAAVATMVFVYVSSAREMGGARHYVRHFFIGSLRNPLYLAIGLLEMVTDLTRVVSLSLRLFLNIAIGEIIIAVFSYLGNVIAPLTAAPFTALELFVGALQAYIFATLSLMYLAVVANMATEHDRQNLTSGRTPGTINVSGNKSGLAGDNPEAA